MEPVCFRCDVKRVVGFHHMHSPRDVLLYDADLIIDQININLGQKDLATILSVWSDNFSEVHYIG